ncbi:HlyD family efflux transporter periplasmic adaptor subunit [Rhodobaculum claviforme]|uniref:Multidrug transporter n=1 Tax=Rhodobaculum claviforme TaxID=1549854 RepID=A0A934TDU2_9RHOB|nr:HlyD family efflux transporter periplasmic adaptor subunit [Rhodobaculum claviforme]MBK5925864.1 multidrug transporter [Rhodobaculum claviforme]
MRSDAAKARRDPRLWIARLLAVVLIGGGVLAIAFALTRGESAPRTDAAELGATTIPVSALVPGRVIEVAVRNNSAVQAGDVLFRVDPEVYALRVAQARAALRTAEAAAEDRARLIENELSALEISRGQVLRARNNLALAQASLRRLENLAPQGFVTAQEVDTARTLAEDAEVTLNEALTAERMAEVRIGTLDAAEAQVELARATLALAERELANTEVIARVDGIVTGLNLGVGASVVPGAPLFTLIDTAEWRVTAFFRETELRRIRIGAPVDVFVLQDPGRRIRGHVHSIAAGIRSQDEIGILGLPVVPSALDWVRVASRFPVEIVLDDPPADLMRLGASAAVVVRPGRD